MQAGKPASPGQPLDPRRIEVIDEQSAAILRRMTVAQRLGMMSAMMREARRSIEHMLRLAHPEWSADQLRHETNRRMSHGTA